MLLTERSLARCFPWLVKSFPPAGNSAEELREITVLESFVFSSWGHGWPSIATSWPCFSFITAFWCQGCARDGEDAREFLWRMVANAICLDLGFSLGFVGVISIVCLRQAPDFSCPGSCQGWKGWDGWDVLLVSKPTTFVPD